MAALSFDDITGAPPAVAAGAAAVPATAPNGGLSFDDVTGASPAAPAAPTVLTVPVGASPTDPGAATDEADLKARFHAAGAKGWQNLADAPGYVNNMVRAAANAVPIVGGLADKLDAATSAALGGNYDASMAQQQSQDQHFAAQNPVSAGAAGFAGAAGGTVAALPAAGLGIGAGSLAARTGTAALAQGALGGADAVVRGEGPALGAGIGAVGGAAGPLIGAGAGAIGRAVAARALPVPQELQGLGPTARSWLDRGVGDASAPEMRQAADAVGPSGFFGERTPGLLDLSKSVADNNGPGKATVREAYQGRMDARNDRVNDLVDTNLGPAQSPLQYSKGLLGLASKLGQARSAMLDGAGPVDISPVVASLNGQIPRTAPNTPQRDALAKALGWVTQPAEVARPSAAATAFEHDPVGSGQTPEMPALPEPPPYNDTAAPPKPEPVGVPRPQSLASFVRSAGGVQDQSGDLAAMGLQNIIARPGQGLGPDAMRQAAAQAGYLGADVDHATANTGVNDLYNALENGESHHSVFDDHAAGLWADRDAAMAHYQQVAPNADPVNRAAGIRPTPPGLAFGGPDVDPNAVAARAAGAPSTVPVSDPTQLHSAKQAFDNAIDYDARGLAVPNAAIRGAQGGYKGARAGINDAMRAQISGYAENQDATSGLMRQQSNVLAGTKDLRAGTGAQNPVDYRPMFEALSPAEQQARQVGMRSAVDQALGTRPNDFGALKAVTQGENGWNGQNLGTAFGPEAADAINTGIDHETQMARNGQKVIGGSPTNENQQIRELTQPDVKTGFLGYLANMRPLDQPATMLPPFLHPQNLGERFYAGRYEAARTAIAPHLVSNGPEADALQSALMQAREQRAAIAGSRQTVDPLLSALMAANVQRGRQQVQSP